MKLERELMRGAGPVAILKLLEPGEKYGYELTDRLERQSAGVLKMGQSTLYPLLYNLEAKGWIKSRIDRTHARPRRYYRLTGKGKGVLAKQQQQWSALADAMTAMGIVATPTA
ncbi:MAG: helix-turn-helix transcriptional regulator [Planctomycetota bacterium]